MRSQDKLYCADKITAAIESTWTTNQVLASVEAQETALAMEFLHELISNPGNTKVTAAFKEKELERGGLS